jgi:16S rRNA (cytidine1402-2'-O)-methyltransferase
MAAEFGEHREILLAREITKTFETLRKSTLGDLQAWVAEDENQRKGEFVLVVEGAAASDTEQQSVAMEKLLSVLLEELPLKQASALAARITGAKKNQVYKLALSMTASD